MVAFHKKAALMVAQGCLLRKCGPWSGACRELEEQWPWGLEQVAWGQWLWPGFQGDTVTGVDNIWGETRGAGGFFGGSSLLEARSQERMGDGAELSTH